MFYPTIGVTEMSFGSGRTMVSISDALEYLCVVILSDTEQDNPIGPVPVDQIPYDSAETEDRWNYEPKLGDVLLRFEGPLAKVKARAVYDALTLKA